MLLTSPFISSLKLSVLLILFFDLVVLNIFSLIQLYDIFILHREIYLVENIPASTEPATAAAFL